MNKIKLVINFVTMVAVLTMIYIQYNWIRADYCISEIEHIKNHTWSLVEHFGITLEDL